MAVQVSKRFSVVAAGVLFAGMFFLLLPELSRGALSRTFRADPGQVMAAAKTWTIPREHLALEASTGAKLIIDYPQDGSIFPREITPPTFIWHDADASAKSWRIDIAFSNGARPLHVESKGEPMQIGAIDPRCVSDTNQLPALTPEQATAHTWIPDAETWALIKKESSGRRATVTFTGLDGANRPVTKSRVSLTTSKDPVDGEIFYRDVPLMPAAGKKGIVQPLSPSLLYLINWRIRDIAQPESRVV